MAHEVNQGLETLTRADDEGHGLAPNQPRFRPATTGGWSGRLTEAPCAPTQGLRRQRLVLSSSPWEGLPRLSRTATAGRGRPASGARRGDRDCPPGPSAPKPVRNVRLLLPKTEMLAATPALPTTAILGTLPHGNW